MADAEEAFAAIAGRLRGEPDITEGTGFGRRPGLRSGGKIFAMLIGDEIVVKLPAERCAELVAGGLARPFDRGKGTPLREWVMARTGDWDALADEALAFARDR
jgi:hypothetical protein